MLSDGLRTTPETQSSSTVISTRRTICCEGTGSSSTGFDRFSLCQKSLIVPVSQPAVRRTERTSTRTAVKRCQKKSKNINRYILFIMNKLKACYKRRANRCEPASGCGGSHKTGSDAGRAGGLCGFGLGLIHRPSFANSAFAALITGRS